MVSSILTAITAYASTSIDYLVILMLIFTSLEPRERWLVYWGDLLETTVLVLVSLFITQFLKMVPQAWILGLLGIVPMIMGIKLIIWGEHGEDEVLQKGLNRHTDIIANVAIITITTCGADNIGIYVPLFAQNSAVDIAIILLTFSFMLSIFCYIGFVLGKFYN
ncbi:cadmium resistance transporter [Lactiplantibacillus plantarum]|uniref:cadmium resistance transporter n=1 Tax=Lactiplantibacillus plantarum TaxID=1590 RepID=UPI0037537BB6